jgi:hypothetical protein
MWDFPPLFVQQQVRAKDQYVTAVLGEVAGRGGEETG